VCEEGEYGGKKGGGGGKKKKRVVKGAWEDDVWGE